MLEPSSAFVEAFERVVHALPHQPEFAAVEIVLTTARPAGRDMQLTVLVDRAGGVDVATCERIAARINASLDAFTDPYTLEVSSAGLNRPLVRLGDYERFAGQNARIITTQPIENGKTHRGELAGTQGENVILRLPKDHELTIPFSAIKAANIEYDIRADLARAKREKSNGNEAVDAEDVVPRPQGEVSGKHQREGAKVRGTREPKARGGHHSG